MFHKDGGAPLVCFMIAALCFHQVFGNSCLAKKYSVIPGHTACLTTSTSATSTSGVSKSDTKLIVDQHNSLRVTITEATDMQKMVWDEELAEVAQKWADNCDFKHDKHVRRLIPGKFSLVGQNIAGGQSSWHNAMMHWFNEGTNFFYGSAFVTLRQFGHYTQMVWANSSKLGCGYRKCTNIPGEHFYVCNYGPSGNNGDISKPYRRSVGSQCSSCPGKCITSGSHKGLCDCNGMACYNGGSINLHTCSCSCSHSFHIQSKNCALECKNTADFSTCGTGSLDKCESDTFDYCPNMCDLCPYAAYDYVEETSAASHPALRHQLSIVFTVVAYLSFH